MIKGLRTTSLHVVILLLLASCTHVDTTPEGETEDTSLSSSTETASQTESSLDETEAALASSVGLNINSATTPDKTRTKLVEFGDSKFLGESTPKEPAVDIDSEGTITLNFQETDIRTFIKIILTDVLSENYIIDPKISGSTTIETSKPYHKEDVFPLLENVLSSNNAAIVKIAGVYHILPKKDIVRGNLAPSTNSTYAVNGYDVRIIPLQYIAAEEMKVILEPFTVDKASVQVDKLRNLLMVSGTNKEIQNIQETINIFDVDWLQGMSVGLYPLEHVSPKVLTTELDSVLAGLQGNKGEPLGGLIRIVPIERLNSVLLISPTNNALQKAELWLYRLDRPSDDYGKELYIYNVQNAKAVELADILNNIFNDGSTNTTTPNAELAPGLEPVDISSSEPASDTAQPEVRTPSTTNSSGLSISGSTDIEFIADDIRNALVILASAKDYKMIKSAIEKLDVAPLQVLIEASIVEVTLNDDLRYGVEWFFKNGIAGSNNKKGVGSLDLDKDSVGIGAILPGFSYNVLDSVGDIRVAINAIESQTDINVVSTPSLMVLDNQQARINVGDQIPIPTRQSTSNIDPNAPTVNEIEFRDTGVSLTVKPRVNDSGLVIMEVAQDVSDAQETLSSGLDAPTIRQRQIESHVAVHSGETIVLGGLMRDSNNHLETGVPILHDIPIIGKLFGRTSDVNRRTELLVFLTPTVIRNREDARAITKELREKMKSLRPEES